MPSKQQQLIGFMTILLLVGHEVSAVRQKVCRAQTENELEITEDEDLHATMTGSCDEIGQRFRKIVTEKHRTLWSALRQAHFMSRLAAKNSKSRECMKDPKWMKQQQDTLQNHVSEGDSHVAKATNNVTTKAISAFTDNLKKKKQLPAKGEIHAFMGEVTIGVMRAVSDQSNEEFDGTRVKSMLPEIGTSIRDEEIDEEPGKASDNKEAFDPTLDDEERLNSCDFDLTSAKAFTNMRKYYDEMKEKSLKKILGIIKNTSKDKLENLMNATLLKEFPTLPNLTIPKCREYEWWPHSKCPKSNNRVKKEFCPEGFDKEACAEDAMKACSKIDACNGIQVRESSSWSPQFAGGDWGKLKYYLFTNIETCGTDSNMIKSDKPGDVYSMHRTAKLGIKVKMLHVARRFLEEAYDKLDEQARQTLCLAQQDRIRVNPSDGLQSALLQHRGTVVPFHATNTSSLLQQKADWFTWWLGLTSWLVVGLPLIVAAMVFIVPLRLVAALFDVMDMGGVIYGSWNSGPGLVAGFVGAVLDSVLFFTALIYATLRCFITGLAKWAAYPFWYIINLDLEQDIKWDFSYHGCIDHVVVAPYHQWAENKMWIRGGISTSLRTRMWEMSWTPYKAIMWQIFRLDFNVDLFLWN